ncbi:MAG: DoxX family protein [Rhodothermales bacterium]|nr:DoxX family protein [Rhodothermales bacterium]
MKARSIISWILFVAVGALYIAIGAGKFTPAAGSMFTGWGLPVWLAPVVGVVEILGGIALMIPRTTRWGVLALSVIMFGAFWTHIANAEFLGILRPVVFSTIFWSAWYLRKVSQRGPDDASAGGANTQVE